MAYIAAMPKAPPPAELGTQRDALPYFAGREAELTALRQRLGRLRSTGDPRGGMSLIMGVPGVGKTQLGLTFARHALSSKGRPKVLHLALSTSLLESDIDLFMAIAVTLNAAKIGREVAELDSNGTRREFGVAGLRAGRTREHARHTARLFALLLASRGAQMWKGPSLQAALQAGHRARNDYYDSRLRLLQGIKPMQALADVMDRNGIQALAIEDAVRELDTAGFDGQAATNKAIAHGVLAEDPPGAVSFGIPSFHGYMVELSRANRA